MTRFQSSDAWAPLYGHVTTFWALGSQTTLMAVCSVPWLPDHNLQYFCQNPVFTSGFWQKCPIVNGRVDMMSADSLNGHGDLFNNQCKKGHTIVLAT